MKELELEDRQYEVDKELNELCQVQRKYWGIVSTLYLKTHGITHRPSNVQGRTKEV